MIPRVAQGGRSFKGAGLYYLHDKGHAETKDRVAFTHTENLPTRDPDQAIKCMAWTAMNAQHLRLHNGGKPINKLDFPVYSYSLAWKPGQEPTKEQMIDAAKDSLKSLGFEQHEALFVAHSDTEHPHIHVIANRVHPVTGKTQNVYRDHLKLSRWAQDYELKWGKILCEQRVENNRRRDAGEYVKYNGHSREQAFGQWRRKRANEAFNQRRAEMGSQRAQHRDERKELFNEKEQQIADRRAHNRDLARPEWKAIFAQQKRELANLHRLQKFAADKLQRTFRETELARPGERAIRRLYSARNPQPVPGPLRAPKGRRASPEEKRQARGAVGPPAGPVRAGDWLRAEKEERSGYLREAFQLSGLWAIELAERHKKERAAFAAQLKKYNDLQLGKIKEAYTEDLANLKERQKQESRALTQRHLQERKETARDIKEGRDEKVFQAEQRKKLQGALDRTKQDIQRPVPKARRSSLVERFEQATGQTQAREQGGRQPERGPGDKAKPERAAPSRSAEFKEQAKDTTKPPAKDREGRKGLADRFREAQEKGTPEQRREEKSRKFKDNAQDLGQDIGRERSRTRKPPGGKPD